MSSFPFGFCAIGIAALYVVYRHGIALVARQQRRLRDRVAFMIWSAAKAAD